MKKAISKACEHRPFIYSALVNFFQNKNILNAKIFIISEHKKIVSNIGFRILIIYSLITNSLQTLNFFYYF